jgi:hypothetical protein
MTGGTHVGISSFNDVGFQYNGQSFAGDFGHGGFSAAAYDGDFLVNGIFTNAKMENVAICFDVAFMQNVFFESFTAKGEYNAAGGIKCFSNIYDSPSLKFNKTKYVIDDSTNVTIKNGVASGFATGWVVSSGSKFTFSNNQWIGNVGSPTQPGAGGLIYYETEGSFASKGHPPSQITISGDQYIGNGNAHAGGAGILIKSDKLSSSEVMSEIHVDAVFKNNVPAGIEATGTDHLSNVTVKSNCSGDSQKYCVGNNLTNAINKSKAAQ